MPEFRSVIELRALNGRNGFQMSGESRGTGSGLRVAPAGDVNGDGFADVIVGAIAGDPPGPVSGASHVVFGKASGFAANLQLSSLDGGNGFQIKGEFDDTSGFFGHSVAPAGDVNGDGFDDVIIGASGEDPHGYDSGASYVVFGKAGGFVSNLELSSLDGASGFQMSGETKHDASGISVASAGDVNGDGFDDVIIGAFGAGPNGSASGASYVVFGKAGGFAANLELSSLNGANGFQMSGETKYDASGISVASAGDVNGDGFADLIVGAYGADPNGSSSGASYVVFGKAGGFAANLQLSNLNGSNGFQISGEAAKDYSGVAVGSAGDVNADGFADLIVGAFGAPRGIGSGASYVVFGRAAGFTSNLELSSLNGSNGFQISGEAEDDISGISVASAGDVNGDGFADLIVGAPGADPNGYSSGVSYVVFGKAKGFASNLRLSSLDGTNGFQLNGERREDRSGSSAASAGDIDNDGFADVIVGAWDADPNGVDSGASYVVFGHRAMDAVKRTGTARDNLINGGRGDDTIDGLGGSDRLIGWQGNDLINGGNGRDRLSGGSGNDRLAGAAGRDFLIGGSGNDIFDFNLVTDSGVTDETRDVIRDFVHLEDKIDLSDLGALTFIGTAAFTGTGQVRVVQQGPNTIVEINLSGDAAPEMTILLEDVAAASLTGGDFIL